jgi:hypothetical protein
MPTFSEDESVPGIHAFAPHYVTDDVPWQGRNMTMRQIAYIAQLGGQWVGKGDEVAWDEQVLQDSEDDGRSE